MSLNNNRNGATMEDNSDHECAMNMSFSNSLRKISPLDI